MERSNESQRNVRETEGNERMSEREREELQRDLEERGKQLEVQRQLHGEEFPKDDEMDQTALDGWTKQREGDLLQLDHSSASHKKGNIRVLPGGDLPSIRNLFSLLKSKRGKYLIEAPNYLCDLLLKSPPPGELARFYNNFKSRLIPDVSTTYPSHPIIYLDGFRALADRRVLLGLIDAQDKDGVTALHQAVFEGNIEQIDNLLANGASTEVKTFMNSQRPIDKLKRHLGGLETEIRDLFRQYEDVRRNNSNDSAKEQNNTEIRRDVERDPFPFLELPVEVQLTVLDLSTMKTISRVQCVCRHLRDLQISSYRTTDLPEMGTFKYADLPRDWNQQELTVIATPTVFHFGMLTRHYYSAPSKRGVDRVIHEMIDGIKKLAKENRRFKYNVKKLKKFLMNSWRLNRRIYILAQSDRRDNYYALYVELDPSLGVGIQAQLNSGITPVPVDDNGGDW
eukprot:TRINITY_DN10136_c0_g1_i1.p1 TRINITY_DN10136_c0_g1~~TRINITY_DN10136_c0_g1_i1.p1  ORF type:complete len:453 (+),score=43.14 TRINITY_DN10136_c0_g1_i1:58-1416(+)